MELLIKKSVPSDVDKVGALYDKTTKYLSDTVNYPKWTHKVYPSVDYAREMIKLGVQYQIEDESGVVGTFVLSEDPNGSYQKVAWGADIAEGEYLVIHALAVSPERFGCGIGRAAVKYCIDKAAKEGYKAVRLDTVPENLPSKRLYENCGFICRGEYDLDRHLAFDIFTLYEYLI